MLLTILSASLYLFGLFAYSVKPMIYQMVFNPKIKTPEYIRAKTVSLSVSTAIIITALDVVSKWTS